MKTINSSKIRKVTEYMRGSRTAWSHCQRKERIGDQGFTMIELLVIVVIISVLVIIAIPTFAYLWNKSKVYRCMEEIRILEKEIVAYQINYGAYPADLGVIKRNGLRDPWGNFYCYAPIPHADGSDSYADAGSNPLNKDFDLYSKGKDKSSDTKLSEDNAADDVIRGSNGDYVGLGDKYEDF